MTAPTLDDVKAFLARSIRGCDAVINGTRIGLTAEHLAEWAHERECFVVALAALDDAERWREAERQYARWVMVSRELVAQMSAEWSDRPLRVRIANDDGRVLQLEFRDDIAAARQGGA